MKRTSAAILLLAGLGGCAAPESQVVEGARPFNKPMAAKTMPATMDVLQASVKSQPGKADVVTADARGLSGGITPTAGFAHVRSAAAGCTDGSCGASAGPGNGLPPYGPTTSGFRQLIGHGAGIVPVPAMGVPGAVAFPGGMGGPGSGMYGAQFAGGRTSIRFVNPAGMQITWFTGGGFPDVGLEAPARYNFPQSNLYRLRLTKIPNRPGKVYYPTLEVYPATAKTVTFLSHSTVPVSFTDEDFEQINAGNLVVKVIYLPDEKYQDLVGVAGADEVVSTRLEPGVNPIDEANRRGTILAVVRVGNADLEDPNTPRLDAPVGYGIGPVPVGLVKNPAASPLPGGMPSAMPSAMPAMTTAPTPTAPTALPGQPAAKPSTPSVPGTPVSLPKGIQVPTLTPGK